MSGASQILIVEDEPKIARLAADYLNAAGYETVLVHRGDEAEARFQEGAFDLVVLDLMLPGVDGLTLCKALRAQSTVPIIMVTARVEEVDRLLGLEVGADDYLCKPFSPRELVARVKAQLRRQDWARGTPKPGLDLQEDALRAVYEGAAADLTRVEFRILSALLAQEGVILSRDQLIAAAYEDHRVVSDRTIDTHMKNLRKKLLTVMGDAMGIRSVYGVGYRWEVEPQAFEKA
jgi:two-component system response regulator BaeR